MDCVTTHGTGYMKEGGAWGFLKKLPQLGCLIILGLQFITTTTKFITNGIPELHRSHGCFGCTISSLTCHIFKHKRPRNIQDLINITWQDLCYYSLGFLPILCPWDLKLTKLADPQTHWHSGGLPGVTNPGPMFKTQMSIQEASCSY